MVFPAHIDPESGRVQTVEAHCRQVARYARDALAPVGLGDAGTLAGLIHDMGKFTPAFRDYILRASRGEPVRRGSVNHTFAGVRYLLEKYHGDGNDGIARLAAEAVQRIRFPDGGCAGALRRRPRP